MSHGGSRKGSGRKTTTGRMGKTITINCHSYNLELVEELASKKELSKVINELLSDYESKRRIVQ